METTFKIKENIEILNITPEFISYMHYIPVSDFEVEGKILYRHANDFTQNLVNLITPNSWGYIYLSGLNKHPNFSNMPYENFSDLEMNFLIENKKINLNIN
jgi:hypothetical protein